MSKTAKAPQTTKSPRRRGDRQATAPKATPAIQPQRMLETSDPATADPAIAMSRPGGKLGLLVERLSSPDGASLADLRAATGWQAHSVRGALAGALKARGFVVASEIVEGTRRYAIRPSKDTAERQGPASQRRAGWGSLR